MTKLKTRPAPGRLVLLRHGQSDWNEKNLFTGWTDVDLTALGREEARRAGRTLADASLSFDIAFTSVLTRAIRTLWIALDEMDGLTALVAAGGVAANLSIRAALETTAAEYGLRFVAPPLPLCTDNAAMVAWAGIELFERGRSDPLDIAAKPRWPLDPAAEPVRGAGVKA